MIFSQLTGGSGDGGALVTGAPCAALHPPDGAGVLTASQGSLGVLLFPDLFSSSGLNPQIGGTVARRGLTVTTTTAKGWTAFTAEGARDTFNIHTEGKRQTNKQNKKKQTNPK